jgi:hypothetical protein
MVDVARFREEYRRAVKDVSRYVTAGRQKVIARHNIGLDPSRTDLRRYLEASETRYAGALTLFNNHFRLFGETGSALDVGGFLGAYPLALSRLGLSVTLAEVYSYYGGALDELHAFLISEGLEVWDVDFTRPMTESGRSYAMVTNMAMLEHLSGSPEILMDNLRAVTAEEGALVLETPNIAYWPTRLDLLRGRTVHPPLDVVYGSAAPFLGHHREYTVQEVKDLLSWTGFETEDVICLNYSLTLRGRPILDRIVTSVVLLWPTVAFRNCRELIMALATPSPREQGHEDEVDDRV